MSSFIPDAWLLLDLPPDRLPERTPKPPMPFFPPQWDPFFDLIEWVVYSQQEMSSRGEP